MLILKFRSFKIKTKNKINKSTYIINKLSKYILIIKNKLK